MASENVDPSLAFLLNTGKVFDVVVLARSTEKALQIIMPWYQMTDVSSEVCKAIQNQALIYAKAIDYSVDAAHSGFAVCEDALTLIDNIHTATMEQKREFLEGVREITKTGLANAQQARNRFIHVRSTVDNLLKRMKTGDQGARMEDGGSSFFIRTPFSEVRTQLTKGIQDLENFHNILTEFVAWWNELAMETGTQLAREEGMLKWKIDEFHLRAVDTKWKNHRSRYALYVNEINIIQDRYPKLFAESKLIASSDVQYLEPAASPEILYTDGIQLTSEPLEKEGYHDNIPHPWTEGPSKPEQTPPTGHDYGKYIPAFLHRPLLTPSNNVIISEHLSPTSYMSATLASVQVLRENLCFIMLQFQCHPSQHRRFNSLRIKWRLKTVRGTNPAKFIDIAPKLAIGARNEEQHRRTFGFKMPAQFNMGGLNAGPELNGEWEMKKNLGYAMHFTGSMRGHGSDAAEWTIEENHSAMTGIPPHFCVAGVIQHHGVLMMELDVLAKQRGTTSLWSSRNHAKEEFPVDVGEASKRLPVYKPSEGWEKWFPLFNGEVVGGSVRYEQETFARN